MKRYLVRLLSVVLCLSMLLCAAPVLALGPGGEQDMPAPEVIFPRDNYEIRNDENGQPVEAALLYAFPGTYGEMSIRETYFDYPVTTIAENSLYAYGYTVDFGDGVTGTMYEPITITLPSSISKVESSVIGVVGSITLIFEGDAPRFAADAFEGENVDICYPGDLPSWKQYVGQNLGGEVSWTAVQTNHRYDEGVWVQEATCTEDGKKLYTCLDCGYAKMATIYAYGHHYGEGTITTAPTCTEEGEMTYICTECGYGRKEPVLALGHDSVDGVCTRCGKKCPFIYEPINQTQCAITGYTGLEMDVIIPETLDGYTVVKISQDAFEKSAITSVDIPQTVTEIGDYAFWDCSQLYKVVLRSDVYNYGQGVFSNCNQISEVWINDLTAWIKKDVHYFSDPAVVGSANLYVGGQLLTNLVIPQEITVVPEDAFTNCSSLKTVTIHDGVVEIGENAFAGCVNLESVYLPKDIDTITWSTFSGCTSLRQVDIPSNVTRIGPYAFRNCTSLTDIYFHGKVPEFAYDCFQYVNATAWYPGASLAWEQYIESSEETMTWMPYEHLVKNGTVINEPACEAVGSCSGTCVRCRQEVTVDIPALGHSYDDGTVTAEATCEGEGVLSRTCSACGKISEEAIPALGHTYNEGTVTTEATCEAEGVLTRTCTACGVTQDEAIPATGHSYDEGTIVTEATCTGEGTLTHTCTSCAETENLTIVANGHTPDNGMCTVCGEACPFVYEALNDTECAITDYVGEQTDVVIPPRLAGYTVVKIADRAFSGGEFTSVTIADTVTELGESAFSWCQNMQRINIGSGVVSVGKYAFNLCSEITEVHISDLPAWMRIKFTNYSSNPLSSRKASLWLNGEEIVDLVVPEGVTSIGQYAFYEIDALQSVTMSSTLVSIGGSAFYGCGNLTDITWSPSVKSVGTDAFIHSGKITGVWISDLSAWLNCYFSNQNSNPMYGSKAALWLNGELVTDLVIPSNVESIQANAFAGCSSLKSIVIPSQIYSIGQFAFYYSKNLEEIYFCGRMPSYGSWAFKGVPATGWYSGSDRTWNEYVKKSGQKLGDVTLTPYDHLLDEPVITKENGCEEDGLKSTRCVLCGITTTEVIPATGHNDVEGECVNCGRLDPEKAVLTGTIQTPGEATLQLYIRDQEAAVSTVTATEGSYVIKNIVPGEYTLRITCEGAVTREYPVTLTAGENVQDVQIILAGDISGDGQLTIVDVAQLYACIKDGEQPEGYVAEYLDLNGDAAVNIGDVAKAYAMVKNG